MKLSSNTSSSSFQAIVAALCVGVFLVISGGSSCAQAQELIFSDVGATNYDDFGYDVAISGNGMYMAAGADGGDVNGISAGYARLYARSGTDWNMIQQFNGTRSARNFGRSLDLSHDGSMLTISELHGPVYVYELSNSSFLYEFLYTIDDDISACEVSVSGDGMVVGVTGCSDYNQTKIFERIGDGFQQRGAGISDYGFSSGIALNYDGSIVIVGDPSWPSNNYTGRAAVFQWRDDNEDGSMQWMQMGSDITGDADSDNFGRGGCVSITYDGLTVSVGAPWYDRDGLSGRGLVRVYNHDSTDDTWKQSGIDLVGDNAGDRFSRTALSSDGAYLAVRAYGDSDYVKTFARNGSNYEMFGEKVPSGEGGYFGRYVDLSADASALVVGDYTFDFSKGKVYLYDTFSLPSTPAPSVPQTSSIVSMNPTASNAKSSLICMLLLWMFL